MNLTPDLVNGLFELCGAAFIGLSIRRVLLDKAVKGVSWLHVGFFSTWGFWNLYYYPSLDQWWSFWGGVAIVTANLVWLALLIYHGYEWNPGQDVVERGPWKETYTGTQFYLLDPQSKEVLFEDIAHSISMQCRYTGHCLQWYSVAEHCCLLADYTRDVLKRGPHDQYYALMHDAAETYTGDISRPLKYGIPGLKDSLNHIEVAVFKALNMPHPEPRWLKEIDARAIVDERAQNMVDSGNDWNHDKFEPLGITLKYWRPAKAKVEFVRRHNRLIKQMEKTNA